VDVDRVEVVPPRKYPYPDSGGGEPFVDGRANVGGAYDAMD